MIIDSLSDTEVYIEQRITTSIKINKNTNSKGLLEMDELGNELISIVDAGETTFSRLERYNGKDGLMLYNQTTKELQIATQGSMLRIRNDYVKGTKYFIGAKRIFSTGVENFVFQVPLDGRKVFKVQLQGIDIPTFEVSGNSIKIIGNSKFIIDRFSKLVVYAYEDESVSNESDVDIEITYETYETVWKDDMLNDPSFFENFRGDQLESFNEATINSSVEEDVVSRDYSNIGVRILNKINNTINLTTFDGLELYSITDSMVGQKFRMLFYNGFIGRVVLVNDCVLSDNMNIIYNQNKNTKSFSIYCGNYIDIKLGLDKPYGRGFYGRGKYGGGKSVRNSARLGETS